MQGLKVKCKFGDFVKVQVKTCIYKNDAKSELLLLILCINLISFHGKYCHATGAVNFVS